MHARGLVLLVLLLVLAGCATAINSPVQSVTIWSEPLGAEVVVDGRVFVTTPGKVQLSRLSSHTVVVHREGYERQVLQVDRSMSFWTFLDIVCLPFVVNCVLKDLQEGGFYTFDDDIYVQLVQRPGTTGELAPPTEPASGLPPGHLADPEAEVSPVSSPIPSSP